jgi:peroxidase
VNEQPNLSVLHTVFLREHNRVAEELQGRNPRWSDERVFQEAKRFVNAEYQHIVYNEWLPLVLGEQFMNTYGLFPLSSGYSTDYDTSFDPRITNEFATAAFRFGHSLIPNIINVYSRVGGELNPSFNLRQAFNKPQLLRLPGMVDGLIAGLTKDNSQRFDSGFAEDVTNNLFNGRQSGLDLVALNLQRGRDHGIAGYNHYREVCGLGRATAFSQLSRQMSVQRTEELAATYASVDDIDLFMGLVSERPRAGALVGPTTLCLVGDQFARLKKGDRYYYETGGQAGSLRPAQLAEVRRASMARILCDNSGVSQLQPLAFQLPSRANPLVACQAGGPIPRPSLRGWGQGG